MPAEARGKARGTPLDATPWLALAIVGGAVACGPGGSTEPPEPPSITTVSLDVGRVNEPYSDGINATGGAGGYTWDVLSGSLPPGLEASVDDLDDGDFLITGNPQTAGDFEFEVRVHDSEGLADTAGFTIVIAPPPAPLAVATHRVPPALAGSPYEVELEADGGTGGAQWRVTEGSLPAGLTLGANGQFSGSPTAPDTAIFTVEVTSGEATATETLTLVVVAEHTDRYDITPFPVTEVAPELEDNVVEAIRRWEAAVTGDLSRIPIPAGSFDEQWCAGFGPMINGTTVDDIIVMINIDSIDGPGGVLGRAGPCVIRTDNRLPIAGLLTLDEADLLDFEVEETATDIIQHEIGHVLGFGTLWREEQFDLLEGAGTGDPRYLGEEAIDEYQAAGGTDETIPVEDVGGEGTRDAHWRESVFGDELMTGFSNPPDMHLSRMSVAAFGDLGYQIDLSAADDEGAVLARRIAADRAGQSADLETIGYDIAGVGPIAVLHPDGTLTTFDPHQRRDP